MWGWGSDSQTAVEMGRTAGPSEQVLGEGAPVINRAGQLAVFQFQWVKDLDVEGLEELPGELTN